MNGIKFLLPALLVLLLVQSAGLTLLESVSVSLAVYAFLRFIDGLGKRLVIVDLIAVLATLMWLVIPIIFFYIYNEQNPLAKLWLVYIPVSSDEYYSYVLPATVFMLLGLYFPFRYVQQNNHILWIEHVRKYLPGKENAAILLLGIGFFCTFAGRIAPGSLGFVFKLGSDLLFVAIFYALYSNLAYKKLIIGVVAGFLVLKSLSGGMFGELVFLAILTLVLYLVGRKEKFSFTFKIGIIIAGFFSLILLQSVKHAYRDVIWLTNYEGNKAVLFVNMLTERLLNPAKIWEDDYMTFNIAVRANQGLMIGQVLDYIPEKKDISYGKDITLAIASSFVPRVLWNNKPIAGGRYNMLRYAGVVVRQYSMNVSAAGEAYGNFGKWGGIVFMFFYGLFFSYAVSVILKLCIRYPSLILWIPFLFYHSVVVETDVLSVLNYLLKASFFAWVIYSGFRWFLKINI